MTKNPNICNKCRSNVIHILGFGSVAYGNATRNSGIKRYSEKSEDLSVVKERNAIQEKEILQKAGKLLINVILKYFPC